MSRSFTIESVYRNNTKLNYNGGRYISSTPGSAAKKAFTHVYNSINENGRMSLILTMKETTQGSDKKMYKYKITRIKETTEIERDGVLIKYNFTTKIKAI